VEDNASAGSILYRIMGKRLRPTAKSLVSPVRLKPFDAAERLVQVIIESPAGSRNKYAYDARQGIFSLKKVLPAGMTFPYDFGFVPQTIAEDGDPLDVLLLMDEPAFPGVSVPARIIGVIQGEQIDGRKKVRNDRLVAVADANHAYANIHKIKDLPGKWVRELELFFVNYHNLEGKRYRLLGCKGAEHALNSMQRARKAK
jgi:inorganic pyrophosphatase